MWGLQALAAVGRSSPNRQNLLSELSSGCMPHSELDTNLGRATRVEGDRMDLRAARIEGEGRMVWDEVAVLEPRAGQSFVLRPLNHVSPCCTLT